MWCDIRVLMLLIWLFLVLKDVWNESEYFGNGVCCVGECEYYGYLCCGFEGIIVNLL